MTSALQNLHDSKIQEIADEYSRAGYEVTIEPGPENLPFALAGYLPDLVARKGESGFIVDVKSTTYAARMSTDRLRTVAAEVAQHDGWRFLLVTADDIRGDELPGIGERSTSWSEILERSEHAHRLDAMGEREAAYLLQWIAFEQLLRFHAERIALPIERLASSLLIRHLYSCGELTIPQFDAALACQEARNRIAHGIHCPELPDAAQQLRKLVRDLSNEWDPGKGAVEHVGRDEDVEP